MLPTTQAMASRKVIRLAASIVGNVKTEYFSELNYQLDLILRI